jgi:hypothetical protein
MSQVQNSKAQQGQAWTSMDKQFKVAEPFRACSGGFGIFGPVDAGPELGQGWAMGKMNGLGRAVMKAFLMREFTRRDWLRFSELLFPEREDLP